ncbi:hypothetical protein P3T76_010748 [Phytophthora citrophthora]|uniref:Uncharacterized protein n=1 Tax=Phytophthora citrophthora TaxID=4793 RepID=A0AAD9GAX7_9STRA|nr:hypothetical protein P3T76_010748 [Phytophthora citrophthora]
MEFLELRRQERELLEAQRKEQLDERRVRRHTRLKSSRSSTAALLPTTLSDIETITARSGFIRQQLKLADLTPLHRWYLELKLVMADGKRNLQTEADDVDAALQACEDVLGQDQRVFDVVYRDGPRVADAREIMLDEQAPLDAREVMSFSTCSNGFIFRITCVHDGKQVQFNSSLYIDNLQAEMQRLLDETSSIEAVINFIWNSANR